MEALIRLFGDICRFKKGPENVPSSINLLIIILIANFIVEIFLGFSVYSSSLGTSALISILSVLTLIVFSWFWLMIFKLSNRLLQTAIAFIGVSLIMNMLCILPITFLWKMGVMSDNSFGLMKLLLIVWILSIYAHIYKKALSISFFLGFALAFTCFIIINTLTINILGV